MAASTKNGVADPLPLRRVVKMSSLPPSFDIADLPDSLLIRVTGYLSTHCQIMLGVALTASSASWRRAQWKIPPSPATRVIYSADEYMKRYYGSDEMSFEFMERDVTARLTDEEVGGVLACLSAVHGEIKNLHLTNCVGITGHCLEPLRGSTQLKSLRLAIREPKRGPKSILKNDGPPQSKLRLSPSSVIPILESIIAEKGCSLRYVDFPKEWNGSPLLAGFLKKYNSLMNSRTISCCGGEDDWSGAWPCENTCRGTDEREWVSTKAEIFGRFNFTCPKCKGSYCADCVDDNIRDPLSKV